MENNTLDMLMSREQLMEDIIAIVDGELSGIISDRLSDELTTRLCDAVCTNFPTKWYSGQPPQPIDTVAQPHLISSPDPVL